MAASQDQQWQCFYCGFIYDEALGLPDHGIPPGTAWADIPEDWTCPKCGAIHHYNPLRCQKCGRQGLHELPAATQLPDVAEEVKYPEPLDLEKH